MSVKSYLLFPDPSQSKHVWLSDTSNDIALGCTCGHSSSTESSITSAVHQATSIRIEPSSHVDSDPRTTTYSIVACVDLTVSLAGVECERAKAGRGVGGVSGGVSGGCASRVIPGSCGDEETLLGAGAIVDVEVTASREGQGCGCCGGGGGSHCTGYCRRSGGLAS